MNVGELKRLLATAKSDDAEVILTFAVSDNEDDDLIGIVTEAEWDDSPDVEGGQVFALTAESVEEEDAEGGDGD